ncbi:hypothetical protein [Rhodovastum atsumiense]|uniref:Uncharacterized protein n=1 Tax=Rhodovastum atsumiense TaxID=504468 RepID=A0A5M6IUV0_9PROT|nr:hypothetical protein [Rhodovastum atsumiense]KAA5611637.1 hypothetical protein F1189_13840 [Rhodovastum atsumiense]
MLPQISADFRGGHRAGGMREHKKGPWRLERCAMCQGDGEDPAGPLCFDPWKEYDEELAALYNRPGSCPDCAGTGQVWRKKESK